MSKIKKKIEDLKIVKNLIFIFSHDFRKRASFFLGVNNERNDCNLRVSQFLLESADLRLPEAEFAPTLDW